jgi:acyl-CoA thioesterase I
MIASSPLRIFRLIVLALAIGAIGEVGCNRAGRAPEAPGTKPAPAPPPAQAPVDRPAVAPEPVDSRPCIVVLGDSLTAGLGLSPTEAYPTLLQHKLDAARLPFRVVNAGISGDTSADGLSRLDLALEGDVRVLIVALGGNDGLRALPADGLERNLSAIIERAQSQGITVVVAGMEAPPNFGEDYATAFRQAYSNVARRYGVVLLPFLLEGVAGIDRLNQRDGIHPTADGARIVADNVWSVLEPLARAEQRHPRPKAAQG